MEKFLENAVFQLLLKRKELHPFKYRFDLTEEEINCLYEEAYELLKVIEWINIHGNDEAKTIIKDALNAISKFRRSELYEREMRINSAASIRARRAFLSYRSENIVKKLPAYAKIDLAYEEAMFDLKLATGNRKIAEEEFNTANEKLNELLGNLFK